MDDERAEAVREWDSRSAGEGHAGLRQLADEGFSGAVEGGRTTALVTNGRIVWTAGGDVDDIDGTRLTAYEAPDDALPLLFAMQERGGETRAKYYTEDTSIAEVNRTLEDGGFTGYVELSENVLSGDYYVVYHGGRSSSVAFVGNSRRLLTGDEAFDRANDEVGIFSVVDATVEVIDVPGDGGSGAVDSGSSGVSAAAAAESADSTTDESSATDPGGATGATGADTGTGATDDAAADGTEPLDPSPGDADRGPTANLDATRTDREPSTDDPNGGSSDTGPFAGSEEIRVGAGLGTPDGDADDASGGDGEGIETKTATTEDAGTAEADGETTAPADGEIDAATAADEAAGDGVAGTETGTGTAAPADGRATGPPADRLADLEAERDRLEADAADAREELARVRDERDDYRADAERLRDRVATLEARIEELEAEEVAEAEPAVDGPSLSPAEALAGTSLFVRYRSKGEPTLEAASRGDADRATVNDNLRIERHTTFETEGATVDEEPFGAFLEDTLAYRFVQWTVRDLLYELRATGNRQEMGDLYDAIPEIDRIELGGEVRIGGSGGSDDAADVREFDVVFRDRMSAPLAVADLHESRTPASGELVEALLDDAKAVAGDAGTVGTAFAVTTSYYEPAAHEAADAATGGGFLSRNRQKSYVKLDRSRGFHLCFVEARDGEFNLNVPEL